MQGRDTDMTGAELRLIREACNLTLSELAQLVNVSDKSVRGWEFANDMRVPVDVADTARALYLSLMDQKQSILDEYDLVEPGEEVEMLMYRAADYDGTYIESLVRNAAAGLAYHALVDDGISVWMKWSS